MSKILPMFGLSLIVLLALAACGSNGDDQTPGVNTPGISVSITDSTCPSVQISPNDTITWVNEDSVEHPITVAYPDGETMVDLGAVQPGESAAVTFPAEGSYAYTCTEDLTAGGTISVTP